MFALDILARPDGGGRLRLLATIEDRAAVEQILTHLGLPAALRSPRQRARPRGSRACATEPIPRPTLAATEPTAPQPPEPPSGLPRSTGGAPLRPRPSPTHRARRRHFVRVQTAEITAAKRLLRSAGLGRGQPRSPQPARWATVLQGVELHRELRAYLEQHRAVRRCAGEQIQALQELLAAHPHPFVADLQRLHTIPGVGPIVAATVVAVLTDVQTMGGFCKGKP